MTDRQTRIEALSEDALAYFDGDLTKQAIICISKGFLIKYINEFD